MTRTITRSASSPHAHVVHSQCGQRHKLPIITMMTKNGYITDDCGEFSVSGLSFDFFMILIMASSMLIGRE
jgi:hypothetical protein